MATAPRNPAPRRAALLALALACALPAAARAQTGDSPASAIESAVSAEPAAPAESPAAAPAAESAPAPEAAPAEAASPEAASPEAAGAEPAPAAAPEAAAAAAPAPAPAAKPAAVRGGDIDTLSGVRLGDSGRRQIAHVIARRMERGAGKHEIGVSLPVQVNGKFTEHLGTGLEYRFHFAEPLAVGAGFTWFVRGVQSSFTEDELINKAKQQPFTASALLLQWEAHAGMELAPIYGKFTLMDRRVVQFGMYVGTGLGAASTRVQLRPAQEAGAGYAERPRTFGDTGIRPVGYFDVGMRVFVGERFALNFEVRDLVYSDQVTRINGCSAADLKNLGTARAPCEPGKFLDKSADGAIAADLLKDPSSDVLNNVSFVGSFSVLF